MPLRQEDLSYTELVASVFRMLFCLVLGLLVTISLADGGMFGRAIGKEVEPGIPHQRAVIKWRDGLEYLFVQSDLAAPAGEYAWLIPLPSPPLYAKASMPEYFDRSFARSSPRRDSTPWLAFGAFSLLVLVLAAVTVNRPSWLGPNGWLLAIFFVMLLGCLAAIFFPVFAQSKEAAKGTGAIVETIGSYEVAVLDGGGADPFEWLTKNGYHPPAEAQLAMERYAKEGWCFVAAKLRKENDRTLPPHPIKLVFKAPIPIYPMRLTAAMGKPMRLELVVVADQAAKCRQLETWSAMEKSIVIYRPRVREPELVSTFESEWVDRAYKFAGDGDIVSYLRADLDPNQMREDYLLEWAGRESVESKVFTRTGYFQAWFGIASIGATVAFALLIPLRRGSRFIGTGIARHLAVAALVGLLLAAILLAPAHVIDVV